MGHAGQVVDAPRSRAYSTLSRTATTTRRIDCHQTMGWLKKDAMAAIQMRMAPIRTNNGCLMVARVEDTTAQEKGHVGSAPHRSRSRGSPHTG